MIKYNLLICDAPFSFSDKLTMSDVKRGAESQYDGVMTDDDIMNLDIPSITADNAVLAFWVPSSKLSVGLEIMNKWGFEQKQTFIWVKIKQVPLSDLIVEFLKQFKVLKNEFLTNSFDTSLIFIEIKTVYINVIAKFNLESLLSFGMGRLFRNCHEVCLIGTKGKVYDQLANKSQRTVLFAPNLKHSAKPEGLQDRLDLMFPNQAWKRIELFARRDRPGYTCVGNECPTTLGVDIKDWIKSFNASTAT